MLKEVLKSKAYVIGGIGVGIALIQVIHIIYPVYIYVLYGYNVKYVSLQLIGVLCACGLARSIKKEYETV